ncbi:MAG: efflux RND transporter permease subunit [Gammaproteobacteria bacterium]|nr:efflux RND transporter permease subunit [Gammaproteobacteria bacterium]
MIQTAIRRPVTVLMVTLATLLFGSVSLSRLDVNLLPDLSYPGVTVRTTFTGAAPAEIETLISKRVEEAVGVIRGVRKVESISRAGQSDVLLEFQWSTDIDQAVLDVRERLDALELPREVTRPLVLRFDPSTDPFARLALRRKSETSGGSVEDLRELRRFSEQTLQRQLETLDGVAAVKISGGLEDEIQVWVDQQKLARLDLSIDEVVARIRAENVNLSGGRVEEGTLKYLVRTLNEFKSVDEIRRSIVATRDGRAIYVEDIAAVNTGHKEREAIIRVNGTEAVEIALYREGEANAVSVSDQLQRRWEGLTKSLPESFELTILYDQAEFIRQAVNNVFNAAIFGGLLAILVLYFFLRNGWSTAVIAVAIPISIIATFNMMYGAGLSLNIMSLGGLALAVGLLVDNSIVVLENIARKREGGASPAEAAESGAREVSSAVVASTLTTVAVFFPMVFVQGVAGQLFSDQALVITFALIISLFVAVAVIPTFAARAPAVEPESVQHSISRLWRSPLVVLHQTWNGLRVLPTRLPNLHATLSDLRTSETARRRSGGWRYWALIVPRALWVLLTVIARALAGLARLSFLALVIGIGALFLWLVRLVRVVLAPPARGVRHLYDRLEHRYPVWLAWALHRRPLVLVGALTLFVSSVAVIPQLGKELVPPMRQGEFRIAVTAGPGTPLERTDDIINQLQERIVLLPGVKRVDSVAGTGNRLDANPDLSGENSGLINVVLERQAYSREAEVIAGVHRELAGLRYLDYQIEHPTLLSLKTPLEVEISGYELQKLRFTAAQLVQRMSGSSRFSDVHSSIASGRPEIQIRFDQERAASLGLLVSDMAQRVVRKVRGDVATRYHVGDRDIDVLVRAREEDRDSIREIGKLIVNPESKRPVTLDTIATITRLDGASEIRRIDQQRVALVSASLAHGDLGSAVAEIRELLNGITIPDGVTAQVSGQSEEMEISFRSLMLALGLAVILVYLVMAAQFESLLHPFVILFTIPLALIGAVFSLFLTGSSVSVVVLIGSIVLAGIVVNNGIVLIDLINRFRAEGVDRHSAIIDAARTRLRPILMTTLTTTLGLLPLALGLGEGGELRAPMAITVIGGLLGSTLLTLFVVPVVYTLLDRRQLPQDELAAEPVASS